MAIDAAALVGLSAKDRTLLIQTLRSDINATKLADPMQVIEASLQPRQREFLDLWENSPASRLFYGGSRGGSKSDAARRIMLYRRYKYPKTNGLIIRRTLDDLRDNHIEPLLAHFPYLQAYWRDQKKVLILPNGSRVRFISAEHYQDIFKLYGKEFADIIVDQSEDFTQEELEFLVTINRCTSNNQIKPKIGYCFNPGGLGHAYNKRVCIEKDFQDNERSEDFAFLRAYGWDNVKWVSPYLESKGISEEEYYTWPDEKRFETFITESDYGRKLNSLPDSDRRAQLLGDMDVFEGQFFSMWRRELHVLPLVDGERFVPHPDWHVSAVIDYGERTVLEVGCRDYEGNVTNFAEVYSEAKTPQERFLEMANMLIERKLYSLLIKYDTNMDIDLKNYTGYDKTPAQIAKEVFAEAFKKAGIPQHAPTLIVVAKASTDKRGYRAVANEAVKEFLYWKKNTDGSLLHRPRVKVTGDCKHLINTLPLLIHDPDSPDGLDFDRSVGIDDPYDAFKMNLLELRGISRNKVVAKPERTAEYMASPEYQQKEIFERKLKKLRRRSADTL